MTLSQFERDHHAWKTLAESPTKGRKKSPDLDFTLLGGMSDSELVQIARNMGIPGASRRQLTEDLISLILGESSEPEDPLAEIRARTYNFVHSNPRISKAEMLCDSQCLQCFHHTVVACYAVNEDLVDGPDNQMRD